MKNIAKLTSYGCYLDCDFVTAKYPEEETHIVGNVAEYVYDLEQKISDLEAKLAEKEKENELMAKTLRMTKFVEKEINQDKISFAVEQLEKVKELCREKFNWWENSEWEGDIYDKSDVSNAYFDIEANIDNQIKQLKEIM